jgi:RNA polymerase sigma-70 factor, ECF subfamily
MNDLELINQIISGDTLGFNQLIRNWEKRIYSFVFRYLGNRDEAMDITQKTFLNTYRHIGSLKDPSRFSSWIYQIAGNLCRDEAGRMNRQKVVSLEILHREHDKIKNPLSHEFMESYEKQPDVKLGSKQLSDIVKNAVRELPEEQRIVVIMKEYQGLKFREIADILNEPVSTIKSRMYSGLILLREKLNRLNITEEVLNDRV